MLVTISLTDLKWILWAVYLYSPLDRSALTHQVITGEKYSLSVGLDFVINLWVWIDQ